MSFELEFKARVPSHETLREKLRATNAEYVGRVLEVNALFDRPDGTLQRSGCGLRVRSITVLDGRGPAPTLTYKGPRTASAFKCREEIEVEVGDAAATTEVLSALGYVQRILFEKRRESWSAKPCRVELDELPSLGTFIEIEGPDAEAIRTVLTSLGLTESDHIRQGYVSMVAEYTRGAQVGPVTLHFG